MATKLDNLLVLLLFLGFGILVFIVCASVCHADVYILTGADSITKVFDTQIRGGSHPSFKFKNYGATAVMKANWVNDANDYFSYPLIDFDISGCPVAAEDVDSAILGLVAYEVRTSFVVSERDTVSCDTISIEVNQVLVQWGEGVGDDDAATNGECSYIDSLFATAAGREAWNVEGCNGLNTDIDATPTGWDHLDIERVSHWIDTLYIDVTDDVKDMLDDPVHPNEYAGWKLTPVGFTPGSEHIQSYALFFTKESHEVHDPNKPKLLIYYTKAAGQVIIID